MKNLIAAVSAMVCSLAVSTAAYAARDIPTAHGIVKVEGEPARVVTLSEAALDTALAVGLQPGGSVATRGSTGVADYLQERAGDVDIVGTAREYNLEAILSLQPDLILAPYTMSTDVYATLSKLAPTIVPQADSTSNWRETVMTYADAMGKHDAALAALDKLDDRIENMADKVAGEQAVSVVRWMPQGPMIMSSKIFTGQLLTQLGLQTPALANSLGDKPHSDTLSLENLDKVDADWLFLAALNEEGAATMEAARKQPAFQRLNVVKQGHVSTVDGQVWTSGTGILAAHKVLDDIEQDMLH